MLNLKLRQKFAALLATRNLYYLRGQAAGVAAQGERLLREANLSLVDVRVYGCLLREGQTPHAHLLPTLRILRLHLSM